MKFLVSWVERLSQDVEEGEGDVEASYRLIWTER